ncbi:MAG: hypothetical protein Q8Q09_22730 [Deltaproteobacteria bacterium]|nr:hypothetical protein [Deltaproteobacteria bacterium]
MSGNSKSPVVKARKVGTKAELIAKVKTTAGDLWIDRLSDEQGLDGVSNKKLLRLQAVFAKASERFKSHAAVIDAIVAAEGRAKDLDYKKHFEAWAVPRLMDRLNAVERTAKRAAAKKSASK